LGHVSRIISLGEKLAKRGHKLFFFSSGNAYQLLRNKFENVYYSTPVVWYENNFGIITSASILNIFFPLPLFNYEQNKLEIKSPNSLETIHRYYDLRKHLLKIKPDVMVADGDMHALRLAQRWKLPSVYITNVIRPSYQFSPLLLPGERFTEQYVKNCNRIIVPDNPKKTICEYNIGDLGSIGIKNKVAFVGSFLDMTCKRSDEEKYIFTSISGPLGTRAKLAKLTIPTLSRLETKSIVSLGEPNSRLVKKVGNCEIHGWLNTEERNKCMREAKIVVFSGSHGTCFEVIKYRKPSICIPTQPEQMANAIKLQELKCSFFVENERQFISGINEMEGRIKFYKENIEKLSSYSSKFKGLDQAVRIIEDFDS
jgi:uncharacterized protein (TIGR00661 family)